MSKAKIKEVNELGTLVKVGSGIALAILLIPVFIVVLTSPVPTASPLKRGITS